MRLLGTIAPKYRVAIEQRVLHECRWSPKVWWAFADIAIKTDRDTLASFSIATATLVKPQQVQLPMYGS
jgi:hypothetical protein